MSTPRLQARFGSAVRFGSARLDQYRLAFHKVSRRDGSGKCDVCFTGTAADAVFGVLFNIADADIADLDRIEDCGIGYERRTVQVRTDDGAMIDAQTYMAVHINPALRPLHWYKEHVLRGAKEHGLPTDYIRLIERIDAIIDTDAERVARELGVYR